VGEEPNNTTEKTWSSIDHSVLSSSSPRKSGSSKLTRSDWDLHWVPIQTESMNPDPGQGRRKWSPKKGKKSGDTIFIRTIWKGGWFSLRTNVLYKV
jgi:hypothetical protein